MVNHTIAVPSMVQDWYCIVGLGAVAVNVIVVTAKVEVMLILTSHEAPPIPCVNTRHPNAVGVASRFAQNDRSLRRLSRLKLFGFFHEGHLVLGCSSLCSPS